MNTVKLTLSSNDIKNLYSSPIVALAAQGSNTIIVPVSISSKYVYGGNNAFSNASNIRLFYKQRTGQVVCTIADSSTLTSTSNAFSFGPAGFQATPVWRQAPGIADNVDIVISISGSSEISGNAANDNSLIIEFSYIVLDLN